MSNADKYFGVFYDNHREEYLLDDTIRRVIGRLNNKVREKTRSSASTEEPLYKPPMHERVIQRKNSDKSEEEKGLEDIIKETKKISTHSHPKTKPTSVPRSNKQSHTEQSNRRSQGSTYHPLKYVADQLLRTVRETLVSDPTNPTYGFMRKLAPVILGKPRNDLEEQLMEVLIILSYKAIDKALTNKVEGR